MPRTHDELRRRYQRTLDKKQDVLYTVPAIMGAVIDGNETLEVPYRPGYIYIRIGDEEAVGQARCRTARRYNLPCIVGYDGITEEFQVLRIRQESYVDAGNQPIPEVEPHHTTHEWPAIGDDTADGSDLVYIHARQVRGCRVSPSSFGAFTVECDEGIFRTDNNWEWCNEQSIDLTAHRPAIGARWVLIYLDNTGTLSARAGDTMGFAAIDVSEIPDTDKDEYALAAVLLWPAQASIQDDDERQDIVDLRWLQSGVSTHEIISDVHTDTTGAAVVGDVLTYTDTGEWAPRPPTGGGSGGGTSEAPFGPRWHSDGALAVVDEVDGVWRLTSDWRIETVFLYVETLGTAGSTIIDIEKSSDDGNNWTSIFPTNRPEIAWNNADHGVTAAPPAVQLLSSGTLLRMNIDQVAAGARNITVEIDGLYQEVLTTGSLLPIMGIS